VNWKRPVARYIGTEASHPPSDLGGDKGPSTNRALTALKRRAIATASHRDAQERHGNESQDRGTEAQRALDASQLKSPRIPHEPLSTAPRGRNSSAKASEPIKKTVNDSQLAWEARDKPAELKDT
jgi:hypothetical protein